MTQDCLHHHSADHRSRRYTSALIALRGLLLLSMFSLSACSDVESLRDRDSIDKTYGSESYYDDYYQDDDHQEQAFKADDEEVINQFLSTDIGQLESGDLTDGSLLVAGSNVAGPAVVLNCSTGVLYVSAGVATGVLATVFASSGVLAAGGGVAVTAPASVPIYATAGGLIGLGLSSSSWASCAIPLAKVGLGLIGNGYLSAARGLKSVVSQIYQGARSDDQASAPSQTQTRAEECQPGGRECDNMTGRYKTNFCNPLNAKRDNLGINIHENGICDFGGLSCDALAEIARLAAGCWRGRQAVTQRCFGGNADYGHAQATEYAELDFFSCIDASMDMSCGDYSLEDRLDDQAQNAYPECIY